MRSQLVKSKARRPKRRRQGLKSWPITFSPFARALALARMPKRHSQNPTSSVNIPRHSHSSDDESLDVRPLTLTSSNSTFTHNAHSICSTPRELSKQIFPSSTPSLKIFTESCFKRRSRMGFALWI
ncbi:hypothetical protein Fmac_004654 [Flemingia macrophylla]|uniref:Uncharacterized protein n=1 Tax=Flemingia macrophylla TaxID=520843 RepID=A0ABD1N5I5_9FABA